MSYKFVKITSYYREFILWYYLKNKQIITKSYKEQYLHLMAQKFAWADYFQRNFSDLGIEAFEIVQNAKPLQNVWAKEHGANLNKDILLEQLNHIKPEVILIQDMKNFSKEYLEHLRKVIPTLKLIIGHCCAPFSTKNLKNYSGYNFVLTCLPQFAKILESNNIKTYKFNHAFDESVIMPLKNNKQEKNTDLIFIGSFVAGNDFHNERLMYIEHLLKQNFDFTIYANYQTDTQYSIAAKRLLYNLTSVLNKTGLNFINNRIDILKKISGLTEKPKRIAFSEKFKKKVIQQSLFGIEMFKVISKAKIGFNIHGGISGNYAANVRMFETAGVGTLLLTDHKKNIMDFYEPDKEIVTYNSVNDCSEKIKWLLNNPKKIEEISKAGQIRTLKDHTIKNRVIELNEIIIKELRKK